MKTKKILNSRENVRFLIKPRQIEDENYVQDTSSSSSMSTLSNSSDIESIASESSRIDFDDNQREELLALNRRVVLKVNNNTYDINYNSEDLDGTAEDDNATKSAANCVKKKKRAYITICSRSNAVTRVAKSLGWKLVRDTDLWNIYWTEVVQGVDLYKDMKRFQKINHFPGMMEICRKDLLARHLTRMAKLFPNDYNIFPKTWCFPADLGDALTYSRQHKNKTYIIKPDQGAQGRGIWLTKTLNHFKPNDRMICQLYLNKPLLIDGYKFDLRVYTLVTSVDPLRIFVYNEGLARFATNKYKEPNGQNTSDVFMHLTNYSVNKHSRTFRKDDEIGSKRKFSTLNRILSSEGYDIEKLWNNIDDVIIKTILSTWPMLKHNYHACFPYHDIMQACFEILGFDIIIDSKMKPYVLEVNHSPSFHTDELIDKEVKEGLIKDTFNLLNLSFVDKKRVLNEDKKRIKTRLLQKIRESSKFGGPQDDDTIDEEIDTKITLSPISKQIAWEESHLGSFRRVMPVPNDPNKYAPFFILQNQASIYSDTAASKRREEAARQFRYELIERAKKDQQMLIPKLNNKKKCKTAIENLKTNRNDKMKTFPIMKYEKYKKNLYREWSNMNIISDSEERERIMMLSQRDFLIKSSGLIQQVYESFYRNELLSDSDRKKYRNLYEKLRLDDKLLLENNAIPNNQMYTINNLNINNNIQNGYFQVIKVSNKSQNNKKMTNEERNFSLSEYLSSTQIVLS